MLLVSLVSNNLTYQIMEEDILNYSPTVTFRGTPCIFKFISNISIEDQTYPSYSRI